MSMKTDCMTYVYIVQCSPHIVSIPSIMLQLNNPQCLDTVVVLHDIIEL